MKRALVFFLLLAMLFCPVVQAAWNPDKLMDKLLQAGVDAIEAEQQRRQQEAQAPADEPAAPAPAGKRTWDDRGKDMLSAFIGNAMTPSSEPMALRVAHMLKDSLDIVLEEYKEEYKAEGREYARELGDIVVERVRQDPQIRSSIYSIQALCWGIIAYLTLVTLAMLACLFHLKRVNTRLLDAVQDLQKRLP